MARVKFLVFALVVLGLWGAHVLLVSPPLSAQALEGAQQSAALAPHAVTVQVQERRLELQRAALKLSAAPAPAPKAAARSEAPTAERLGEVRSVISSAVSEELHGGLVVALVNEGGAVASRGAETLDVTTLDLEGLSKTGHEGVVRDIGGDLHFFHAIPAADATIVFGAPAFGPELLERALAKTQVPAMGIVRDGKVLAAAGAQKAVLEQSAAAVKLGTPSAIAFGNVLAVGPAKLPVLTTQSEFAGKAPLWVGGRTGIPGLPLEIVTVVSLGGFMGALAQYQQLALFAFAGLLALTIVFALIMRSPRAVIRPQPAAATATAPVRTASLKSMPAVVPPAPAASATPPPPPAESLIPELPPEPEATPDDFPFGNEAPRQASPPPPPPPPVADADPFQGSNAPQGDEYDAPTRAGYHAMPFDPPPQDPFAHAAAEGELYGQPEGDGGDDNPDATRVAAVPAELLQQAARTAEPTGGAIPLPGSFAPPPVAAPTAPTAPSEDSHFLEVYQAFIQTRDQCGEAADGLTYDKFALKLRKNREQLTAKYACRTVRFQVYVKEGKAALKATPIKD